MQMKIALQFPNVLNAVRYPSIGDDPIINLQDETAPVPLQALLNRFRRRQAHGNSQVINISNFHLFELNFNPRLTKWWQTVACFPNPKGAMLYAPRLHTPYISCVIKAQD
jgi:hypothetical protein